jgi:hypothetical protein
MNKTEAVNDTKRANKRLKPIVEMCEQVCKNPGWEKAPRQFQLAFKRLDRELKPTDEHGKDLRDALVTFQQASSRIHLLSNSGYSAAFILVAVVNIIYTSFLIYKFNHSLFQSMSQFPA